MRSNVATCFYYVVKPLVPRMLRMQIRHIIARRRLSKVESQWPILHGTVTPPKDWTGWPNGKRFAVVLTHDVEGPAGLANVRRLAELEMEMGFRSSFNFVPEGSYRVTPQLRDWLTDNGFEVGVHDLHHDGWLYSSREAFHRKARKINKYLSEWKAVGFRSAFMFHRLDWLHDLRIAYDASTFDTDPFEPQPDGLHTVFPDWISHRDGGGYVELPYTLPQDSTLFLVLRETTIERWARKLDWLADVGGMALVNVHPDYLAFNGRPRAGSTYSVERYRELLGYLTNFHADAYWHALPRAVADFARASVPFRMAA